MAEIVMRVPTKSYVPGRQDEAAQGADGGDRGGPETLADNVVRRATPRLSD